MLPHRYRVFTWEQLVQLARVRVYRALPRHKISHRCVPGTVRHDDVVRCTVSRSQAESRSRIPVGLT